MNNSTQDDTAAKVDFGSSTTAVSASGDEISLKFTENLATFTDDNTDVMDQFTVKVNGVEATIDAVSLSGNNTVVLGVDTSIETSDEVTVAYTAGSAALTDAHDNATAIGTIGETAVMNNSTQDDTAAKVDFGSSTTAVSADGNEISLKFTENLATFTDDNTDVMDQFTVKVNGVEATIDAVSLSGNNTVVLGVDTSIETSDEVTVAYTAGSAALTDAHDNATAIGTITETAVMNNSTQDDTAAKVDFGSSTTAVSASGDEISLKFTENLATFTDDNTDVMDQFTVKVNGVEATIDAVSLSGNNTVVLGVDTSIETSDEVTVAYTAGSAALTDAHDNATAVGTIGETAVMNNSTQDDTAAKVDFGSSTTAVSADGNEISLKFNENLATFTDDNADVMDQFTVKVNGVVTNINGISLDPANTITLSLSSTVKPFDAVTVAYVADAAPLTDVHSNLTQIDTISETAVTNPVSTPLAPTGQIIMSDIAENSTLTFTVSDILSLIEDPNLDVLSGTSITSLSIEATSSATVSLADDSLAGPASDTWTFTPGDFYGQVKLTAVVSDGSLSTSFESLFNVLPLNDAPVQSSASALTSVSRGQDKEITLANLLANFSDTETTQLGQSLADNLSIVGNSVVADKGTISYDTSTSSWTYNSTSTNSAGESITDSGTVTLSYVVTDGVNQSSGSATFTVEDVNASLTGYIEFSDIIENSVVKFTSDDILNRITDPNADPLTYSSITSLTIVDKSTGQAIPNSSLIRQDDVASSLSTFTFSPRDFTGTVTMTAVVDDNNDNGSNTFTVDFDVLSVNDPARFNSSDDTSPVLASASLSYIDSKSISLYFTEALEQGVVIENDTFVLKDSDDNVLSYSTNRDLTDYSSDGTSITLLLDSAVTDLDDLKVSYSGTSVVDASSANSSAGNALDNFTDRVVSNTRVASSLITDSSVSADGLKLTLNVSRSLDNSVELTSSTFTVETSSDGSNWESASYSVDGDSSDYSNGSKSIVLRLLDAISFNDQVRVSLPNAINDIEPLDDLTVRNSSRVFSIETLSSTNSIIYEDLGFDGTPTTSQITSLAAESTVSAGSFVVGNYYTIVSTGDTDWSTIGSPSSDPGTTFKASAAGEGSGVASTNFEILDAEILSRYYDVEDSSLFPYIMSLQITDLCLGMMPILAGYIALM